MANITRGPKRWLLAESRRNWLAVSIAMAAMLVTTAIAITRTVRVPPLLALLGSWNVYALAYLLLTLTALWRASADDLATVFAAEDVRATAWGRMWRGESGGASWAVFLAFFAFAAAASTAQGADRQGIALLVTTVATAWSTSIVAYAVTYARAVHRDGGLTFPGEQTPGFVDYLYFATAVQSTFGTTDVQVSSRRLRRTVTGHVLFAFLYNVVIIALVLSILTSPRQ